MLQLLAMTCTVYSESKHAFGAKVLHWSAHASFTIIDNSSPSTKFLVSLMCRKVQDEISSSNLHLP